MRRRIATAIAVVVCASSACAQFSGYAEVLGSGSNAIVQLNLYERHGTGAEFPDDCVIQEVRAGSQNGPIVWQATLCNDVPVAVAPYGQATGTWNLETTSGSSVEDGHYYLMVRGRQIAAGADTNEQWFPVTVARRATFPSLVGNPIISEGVPQAYAVSSPLHAGMPYIAAVSLSTQSGFDLFGGYVHIGLDVDQFFLNSVTSPNAAPYSQFQGTLDAGGNAAFSFTVPTGLPPSLHHLNVHVQVLIWDGSGANALPPVATNVSSGVLFLPQP